MSEVEIITDGGRRHRWITAEKLRIVEETLDGSESISAIARRNGVAPNLFYRWRKLMLEGGSVAVTEEGQIAFTKILSYQVSVGARQKIRSSPAPRDAGCMPADPFAPCPSLLGQQKIRRDCIEASVG